MDPQHARPHVAPGTETLVDFVNYAVYQSGEHKCIYDAEKLARLLKAIGYRQAGPSTYRERLDPGAAERRRYSLYFEAVK